MYICMGRVDYVYNTVRKSGANTKTFCYSGTPLGYGSKMLN